MSDEKASLSRVLSRGLVQGAILMALPLSALAACTDGPVATLSPPTAISPTDGSASTESRGPSEVVGRLITSRWPPGVEAVVVHADRGLYVADEGGVRWAKVTPPPADTRATIRGFPPLVRGVYGEVCSANRRFIAYADSTEELVVRSLIDGRVEGRFTLESEQHAVVRAVSDDGTLVALVSLDEQSGPPPIDNKVPWTVTVADSAAQKLTEITPLTALVNERIRASERGCALTQLAWLPDHTLLVGLSGDRYETYIYDRTSDSLNPVSGLGYIWTAGPEGLLLGSNTRLRDLSVWHGAVAERIGPDASWPEVGTGAISSDGKTLVLMVSRAGGTVIADPHGWQTFRRTGSEWLPSGPVARVDWMNQPPGVATSDGRYAWTGVSKNDASRGVVLVSHDFVTGAWDEWFRPEDLQLPVGFLYWVGVIPEN